MSRNFSYTTGNLFDYLYYQKYKPTRIDLTRETNMSILQKINFTGKLDNDATMFFIAEKQILHFSLDFLIVTE